LCGSGSPPSKCWRKRDPVEEATRALGVNDESGDGDTGDKGSFTRWAHAEYVVGTGNK